VPPGSQNNGSPGQSWHSSAGAPHSFTLGASPASGAASHVSPAASQASPAAAHTSGPDSHSAASAAHTVRGGVSHANPRSGGPGNSHSPGHPAGRGGPHPGDPHAKSGPQRP
jgi:hypothetical protein